MDLSLTETQTMLKDAATQFMETELPKQRVREVDESPTGFNQDIWQKMCNQEWAGMVIPEQYGGSGSSFTDLAVLHEVLGYFACSSPLLDSAVLSAHAILEAGDESQKSSLLPAIAKGQQICSFAFTEPEYGWGPGAIKMRATSQNGNHVLNGTKVFVPWAHVADQILVVARTSDGATPDQGISLFLVDKNAQGISTRLQRGWIGDKVCEVNFNNVQVQPSNVIGPVGGAWPAIERSIDRATAVLSAYMGGGAQKAYEMARDYSTQRIAFGVPIGTFQRVQDHIIISLTEAESIKWTAYEALWRLDGGHDKASVGISMAKAVASDGFSKCCDSSQNVHAGIGVDLDLGLTHYTVRSRTFQHYLGDANYHRRRMAQLMNVG
jgi:alkylation response protein AidB-like acyl-CoA dehydrogenase